MKSIIKYLLNHRTMINTETLYHKNGNIKLKLSKRRRNFKILWVLDQYKKQNAAFVKIKEMLIERRTMFKKLDEERFGLAPIQK